MIKAILLDLDNTVYKYDPLNSVAEKAVFQRLNEFYPVEETEFRSLLKQAKTKVKKMLPEQAASHNRLLYMQILCELVKVNPLTYAKSLYDAYWDTFLEGMSLTNDVKEFFEANKSLPICLVTDLTAHIQYRKIEKLGLDKWISSMVTSEEVGIEKPHPIMFLFALQKLSLTTDEVVMIGDSFKKDILGASDLGIKSYWISPTADQELPDNVQHITSLAQIGALND